MGITAAISGFLATDIGIGAATADIIAAGVVGAGEFGLGGAAIGGITGGAKGALSGFEAGALTGLGGGIGGALGAAGDLGGIGAIGGGALGGAAGGALGHGVTGGNPLTGALTGGLSGAALGLGAEPSSGAGAGAGAGEAVGGATGAGPSAAALSAGPGDVAGITIPNNPVTFGDVGAVSPEAGFGGSGAAGIPATTSPGLASQIAQGVGLQPPTQGLNPLAAGGTANTGLGFGTPGGGGAAPAATGGAAASPGFLKSLSSGDIGGAVGSLSPSTLLGGAGLAYEALKPQPAIPNLSNLNSIAGQLQTEQSNLLGPLANGAPLPAGAQSSIDQGVKSAQAAIRSQFASMGLAGSSMEASALAEAEQSGVQQRFQVAQQMAQTGGQLAGLDVSTYQSIMQSVLGQDQQLQNAIIGFSQAAAGGGTKIQIGGGSNG